MPVTRRFLIAPSLTRLVRKELGFEQVSEGHFAPQSDRQSCARIERNRAYLVLTSLDADPEVAQDFTEVPLAHAEALLQVCPGTLTIERSSVSLSAHEAFVDRFIGSDCLDVISVDFSSTREAAAFAPPIWFGPEVSQDDSYLNRVIALSGLPPAVETEASNVALEAVLDIVEGGASRRPAHNQESAGKTALGAETGVDAQSDATVVTSLKSLPVVRPFGVPRASDTGAIETQPTEPQSLMPDDDSQERLADVVKGLSNALSQASSDENGRSGARPKVQLGWRRSSH
jgi:CYTH domain-containing protein